MLYLIKKVGRAYILVSGSNIGNGFMKTKKDAPSYKKVRFNVDFSTNTGNLYDASWVANFF